MNEGPFGLSPMTREAFSIRREHREDSLLLRELTAEARKAEHCPSCFDRHASAIIRRLLTRTEPLPATEDHPT